MALTVKEGGSNFAPAPAGNHPARCIGVVDLGTQYSAKFDKASKKVRLMWELPNETKVFDQDKGPEPFVVGRNFTASLSRNSALRPILESWRGRAFTPEELKGFELKKLVGVPCLLNIVHETRDDKTYANITAVSPLPKGLTIPPQQLKSSYYEIEQGKDETFQGLPEWLQELIGGCQEWNPTKTAPQPQKPASGAISAQGGPADDDNVPF